MARCTVIGMAHCVPGHAEDVTNAAAERLRGGAARSPDRLDAYLFEDRTDPNLFIYVGRWMSEAAFEAAFRQEGMFGQPDWYADRPTVSVYRPLWIYSEELARSKGATLTIVEGDATSASMIRQYLLDRRQFSKPRDYGIVEVELGEDVRREGRFMYFVRWRSLVEMESVRIQRGGSLRETLAEFGATMTGYDGRVRAET